jgi:hypothetical protein
MKMLGLESQAILLLVLVGIVALSATFIFGFEYGLYHQWILRRNQKEEPCTFFQFQRRRQDPAFNYLQ